MNENFEKNAVISSCDEAEAICKNATNITFVMPEKPKLPEDISHKIPEKLLREESFPEIFVLDLAKKYTNIELPQQEDMPEIDKNDLKIFKN
jgi:hypothetical protein